jgi:hypothetical protein
MAAWLFIGVAGFSAFSPITTSADSRWNVFVAMSLWRHGDSNLDEYRDAIQGEKYYAVECVSPDGKVTNGAVSECNGHFYNSFPIGSVVVTAPLVLTIFEVFRLAGLALPGQVTPFAQVNALLRGDFDTAHPSIEKIAASILIGAAAVVLFLIARRFLSVRRSALLAVIFGMATSAYSTGGRALWQHTPSMLLLCIIILMLMEAANRPAWAGWAGVPVALSYTVRPTDSLFVLVFTAYVAVRYRAFLSWYLLGAAAIAAVYLSYNLSIYHGLFSPYYQYRLDGLYPANWLSWAKALAGDIFSPGRGLLIYTPVFAFSIWSMFTGMWRGPLSKWLAVLVGLHALSVSSYIVCWWGGDCYGPRFFTDVTPILVLFLIPFFAKWEELSRVVRIAFAASVLIGLAIHVRAGWSIAVWQWNSTPVHVNDHPERNWDWRDPPFLRRSEK